jgi:hypothetical protein
MPTLHLDPAQHGLPAKPQVLQTLAVEVLVTEEQIKSVLEHAAEVAAAPLVGQHGSSCLPHPQRPAEHLP